MFFYAFGESLRISYRNQSLDLDTALRGLCNPAWLREDESGPTKRVIARHCKVAFKSLIDAYKEASKEQGFKHRNWFRSDATLKATTDHAESSWSLLSDHAEEYLLPLAK
jgi:hypothetical protein